MTIQMICLTQSRQAAKKALLDAADLNIKLISIKRPSRNMVEQSKPSSRREDFYLRYYVGHKGRFGHEFLEFEIRDDGRLRYANNSQYKAENLIRKEVWVNDMVVDELKRIIQESEILK